MAPLKTYLHAAQSFSETSPIPTLAPLTSTLLADVTACAAPYQFDKPQLSWALLALTDQAARLQESVNLQAEAAWWLAWGANVFFRPTLVNDALARAEALFSDERWLAACLWQRNVIVWIRPNFSQAAQELSQAYDILKQWRPAWATQCQLTLSFALMLAESYDEAEKNLAQCEQNSVGSHYASVLLLRSALNRRNNRIAAALKDAQTALQIFQAEQARFGVARAKEYIAVAYLQQERLGDANCFYHEALKGYTAVNLPLLIASCHNGLAQVANRQGRFDVAHKQLTLAYPAYQQVHAAGAMADNLIDTAVHSISLGHYQVALRQLQTAKELYQSVGSTKGATNASLQTAYCHIHLGSLQRALSTLERMEGKLYDPELQLRSLRYQANVYNLLNDDEKAQGLLVKSAAIAEEHQLIQSHCVVLCDLALLAVQQNRLASNTLDTAISLTERYGLQQQKLQLVFLQAEWEITQGFLQKAQHHLKQLLPNLRGHNMVRCLLALARCESNRDEARKQCEEAWRQAKNYPYLRWQASELRAELAEEANTILAWLRNGLDALLEIRRGFSSPDLAGSFWKRPTSMIDAAVRMAADVVNIELLQQFIEESKALTLVQKLHSITSSQRNEQTGVLQQLDSLRLRINWLVRVLSSSPPDDMPDLLVALQSAEKSYAETLQRIERSRLPDALTYQTFDWRAICATLNQHYDDWIALDYYVLSDEIICVAGFSDGHRTVTSSTLPTYALEIIAHDDLIPDDHVRLALGALIPDDVRARLSAKTLLIIAPHRHLHKISWAGIFCNAAPLVANAIITIVPSLQATQLLLAKGSPKRRNIGTLLAVSEFQHGYDPLPAIKSEATWLKDFAATKHAVSLHDISSLKSWDEIDRFVERIQLSDFWHIATHAFFDDKFGWNSGFALAEQDVWLDQLWDIAPLPDVMTFSACSGGQRLVLAGDEQIGLPMLCLAAGAKSIISSLRPVDDEGAENIVRLFYTHYLAGASPASALATAQRELISLKTPAHFWQDMQCFGL